MVISFPRKIFNPLIHIYENKFNLIKNIFLTKFVEFFTNIPQNNALVILKVYSKK
jgi:hypothetical protein